MDFHTARIYWRLLARSVLTSGRIREAEQEEHVDERSLAIHGEIEVRFSWLVHAKFILQEWLQP